MASDQAGQILKNVSTHQVLRASPLLRLLQLGQAVGGARARRGRGRTRVQGGGHCRLLRPQPKELRRHPLVRLCRWVTSLGYVQVQDGGKVFFRPTYLGLPTQALAVLVWVCS